MRRLEPYRGGSRTPAIRCPHFSLATMQIGVHSPIPRRAGDFGGGSSSQGSERGEVGVNTKYRTIPVGVNGPQTRYALPYGDLSSTSMDRWREFLPLAHVRKNRPVISPGAPGTAYRLHEEQWENVPFRECVRARAESNRSVAIATPIWPSKGHRRLDE